MTFDLDERSGRNAPVADVLFATLDLNIAFASLSTGSVVRLSGVTP